MGMDTQLWRCGRGVLIALHYLFFKSIPFTARGTFTRPLGGLMSTISTKKSGFSFGHGVKIKGYNIEGFLIFGKIYEDPAQTNLVLGAEAPLQLVFSTCSHLDLGRFEQ
jgi:hypothetical protein